MEDEQPTILDYGSGADISWSDYQENSEGLVLHQHHYTEDFLKEHSAHRTARKRLTSGEPDHFRKDDPLPPDPDSAEHQTWIKRGQRVLGGLLWLSTRTRPVSPLPRF